MDITQLQNALKTLPLFNELRQADIEQIIRAGNQRKTAQGEYLFMQGDSADFLMVLLAGRVKITQVSDDGQQILLRIASSFDMLGAVALSPTQAYPASAQADEDCLALYWKKDDMMRLAKNMPQLALNAVAFMAKHVRQFQDRYRELATQRVERRLAGTILRLANQAGKKTSEGVLIDLPLTRQDLAEMSGTTLYTVSRILSQWEEQGLVLAGRGKVTIRYPHGLVAIAQDLRN